MNRRTRFVAGILAFLALTFSFAESVWASTCIPGMQMDTSATMVAGETPEAMDCMSDCMSDQRQEREGDDRSEGERNCPFGSPIAAQACAGIVLLPTRTSDLLAPSFEGAGSVFTLEAYHDLLLDSMLFRPPRA